MTKNPTAMPTTKRNKTVMLRRALLLSANDDNAIVLLEAAVPSCGWEPPLASSVVWSSSSSKTDSLRDGSSSPSPRSGCSFAWSYASFTSCSSSRKSSLSLLFIRREPPKTIVLVVLTTVDQSDAVEYNRTAQAPTRRVFADGRPSRWNSDVNPCVTKQVKAR